MTQKILNKRVRHHRFFYIVKRILRLTPAENVRNQSKLEITSLEKAENEFGLELSQIMEKK